MKIARIYFGGISIPLWLTRKPKKLLEPTSNAHLVGFNCNRCLQSKVKAVFALSAGISGSGYSPSRRRGRIRAHG